MNDCTPSDFDIYLFHQGNNFRSYQMLGAHLINISGVEGTRFALWAPNASKVQVVGNFNHWQGENHSMQKGSSGIWNLFIPEIKEGEVYKYEIHSPGGEVFLKADPYAFYSEPRPHTGSVVCSLEGYQWHDQKWQREKKVVNSHDKPMLVYEIHLGSWKCKEDGSFFSYLELAEELVEYVARMGYTHIELLPIMEHPYDGSWGYQITGYYSATSRYGSPSELMYFIDICHQRGIGVILDWVPSHFCKDNHGLRRFDGTPLYEDENPNRAENWQWGSLNFNLGKPEVESFLVSNALFWLDVFHIDGLRVDAVANIIYLDYGKEEWMPNCYGGRENLEGIAFLKKLNETVFHYYPEAQMMAEESTVWPNVSKPTYMGGLGFNYKWNMGWMNDMLRYMELDPIYRKWNHNLVTFSFLYAFTENFMLPLSHDEVVHGKKSLLNKMPGDYWQKFANLRVFYGYMMTHPGKKLLFMGGEFGQFVEWDESKSLDWNLLEFEMHKKLQRYVKDLNYFYLQERVLWELDHVWQGFQWIDPHNGDQSIISFVRRGKSKDDYIIVICNFTPVVYEEYLIGVPQEGTYREVLNSDWDIYGGSHQYNGALLETSKDARHSHSYSIKLKIPPLAVVFIKRELTKGEDIDEEEKRLYCDDFSRGSGQ